MRVRNREEERDHLHVHQEPLHGMHETGARRHEGLRSGTRGRNRG